MRSPTSRRSLLRGAFGLATTFALSPILAACGGQQPVAPAAKTDAQPTTAPAAPVAKSDAKPTTAAAAPAAAPKAGSAEIVYLNQSRGQAKAMEMLAEKYTQQSGVKVTIDSPGPVDYPKKLQAASQAGNMPDAYYAIGAADMAPYYKAGFALNLKPELDKGWSKNFQPTILELIEWKDGNPLGVAPGIYHAPWEANSYGIIYNPAHLEKAKVDPNKPPATTSELLDALKAIKSAGVGPFGLANDFIHTFLQAHVSNWLTDQEIDATQAGKSPWSTDAYKKALQFFVDLRDAGVIFNNTLNADNPTTEKSFFNVKELAMFYTGVFSIPVQVTTAPDFTAYSAFALPKAPDAKLDPRPFGGAGKNGVVNPKGKQVEESLKYVKWLTDTEAAAVFMEVVPLVSTNPAADQSKILPQLKPFAAEMPKIQKVVVPRTGPVNEAFIKGVQSLLLKEKTVDQILEDADKAQKG